MHRLGTLLLSILAACGSESERARPNVLLISIDSLRADHLGCYGYERETSPMIDRLAEEGVLFETCIASTSWTLPAHAAMFTGLPDSIHGADRNGRALPDERRTLAESFRDAGYATAGFWSGPFLDPAFGLSQGFEDWIACGTPSGIGLDAHQASHRDVTGPRVLAEIDKWIARYESSGRMQPFFLFVHLWDVHYDYVPPPPYDTLFDPDYTGSVDGRDLGQDKELQNGLELRDLEHLVALYDGEIAWTDKHVGELVMRVDELAPSTLVALTADHGEEFFEHGRFGHRRNLFEESIHVPWVLRWPGELPAGQRVADLTRGVDLAPTLLELAGLPPMPGVMGRSMAQIARGTGAEHGAVAISELVLPHQRRRMISVRVGDEKVVLDGGAGLAPSAWFDLGVDPGELQDRLVGGDLPPATREMVDAAARELSELREHHPQIVQPVEVPSELEEQLRTLGYLEGEE